MTDISPTTEAAFIQVHSHSRKVGEQLFRGSRLRALNPFPRRVLPDRSIVSTSIAKCIRASRSSRTITGDLVAEEGEHGESQSDAGTRKRERRSGQRRRVNDGSEKKRDPARGSRAQEERENVASSGVSAQGERSVHSLSDRRLKATLNEMNAFTCLLRLPSRIHSPFHFKCSAALFWVAALSSRPPRCTHHSSLCPSPLTQYLRAPPRVS